MADNVTEKEKRDMITHLKILKLAVLLQLQDDCTLPAYKGSMWHGWLGNALRVVNDAVFNQLYQSLGGEQPKPYAISPGDNAKTQWRKHEFIEFGITLFGEAVKHATTLVHALQAGQVMGIGSSRTALKLVMLSNLSPTGPVLHIQPYRLADYLQPVPAAQEQMALHLLTPLRVKHLGKVLKTQESLTPALVIATIRRRLLQLNRYWGTVTETELEAMMTRPIATVSGCYGSVYYEDWQRFSLKQHEFLPFGGLTGVLFFEGVPAEAYQWFQLAALLQIGGKTTFGLGCLKVVPGSG